MTILSHTFCTAYSRVKVHSSDVADLLCSEDIGIGQLLERLGVRPTFVLRDIGRNEDGGLWRYYSMICDGMLTCDIREDFSPIAWMIEEAREEETVGLM